MPRISPWVALVLTLAACSNPSSPAAAPATSVTAPAGQETAVPAENNPPGDIPDNVAFVEYANTAGKYRFTHPEGWAEKTQGATVTFTDKLNGVQATVGSATTVPTGASATGQDVPALQSSQAAFELRGITEVSVPAGSGVRIVYRRNSAPDAVTGRQYRDEVERYEIVAGGREVIIELFGPVGADNVDAYRTMINSLKIA
ncbi:hypothetical protein [Actinoplanes sp. HUAS TT8]|uniref:hypothetical protein n=1 Tax=Actinoplanes sp. HUAS TT8 TaxID=3447453 RepID=UPI003F526617